MEEDVQTSTTDEYIYGYIYHAIAGHNTAEDGSCYVYTVEQRREEIDPILAVDHLNFRTYLERGAGTWTMEQENRSESAGCTI